MRKLLLTLIVGLCTIASQALTIDFMKTGAIAGLATASAGASDTPVDYTVDGTTLSIVQGYHAENSYLMLVKSKGSITFTAPKAVSKITVVTPTSGTLGANATLQLITNNVDGEAQNAGTNGKSLEWTPAVNAAGTTYVLKNVKNPDNTKDGNVQVAQLIISYVGEDEEPPVAPETKQVDNIAALLAANADVASGQTSADTYQINSDLTAIFQNGSNLYVTDNKGGWLLIFGSGIGTFKNGDVIPAGIQGQYKNYSNLPEFLPVPASVKPTVAGTPVEPIATTVEDVTGEAISAYVKLTGVSISNINGKNFTITDAAGNTVAGYNTLGVSLAEGTGLTILGFNNIYNTTRQVSPSQILTESGKEQVKTPYFNPAAGELLAGSLVKIICQTPDASIYYTLDSTTPTDASTLYTGQAIEINENTTIKAIAYADGMEPSAVAVAEYTIKVISPNTATFNFNEPASLNPACTKVGDAWEMAGAEWTKETSNDNHYFVVNDVTYTNGNVTVSNTKGTSTDARLYFQTSGATQLRVYSGGSTTIASTDATNPIVKITFTWNNGKTSYDKITAPTNGTWAQPTWTGSAQSVEFKYTGTQQINSIEVTCLNELSGIENIVDNTDAPVEYFNLQGVRVENPSCGLYIRRQGNTASKVIL